MPGPKEAAGMLSDAMRMSPDTNAAKRQRECGGGKPQGLPARETGVSVLTSLTAGYPVCYIGCMKTMGLLLRGKLTSVLMLVFGTLFWVVPARAFPAKGTPAPPLTTLPLLQAPMGTRSDW